jgi:hypothetical protein
MKPTLFSIAVWLGVGSPVVPCSVLGPLPTPQALVKASALIVHAKVEGFAESPGATGNVLAWTPRQVSFRVIEVLKGSLVDDRLAFNGRIDPSDDWNDRPVPYDFIRPSGRAGSCFAVGYRNGAEYLLLLNQNETPNADSGAWSPYWRPLSATNEQVTGKTDAWLKWVRTELQRKTAPNQRLQPTATEVFFSEHQGPRLSRNR